MKEKRNTERMLNNIPMLKTVLMPTFFEMEPPTKEAKIAPMIMGRKIAPYCSGLKENPNVAVIKFPAEGIVVKPIP